MKLDCDGMSGEIVGSGEGLLLWEENWMVVGSGEALLLWEESWMVVGSGEALLLWEESWDGCWVW